MPTKAVYHHLTPQTYMRAWKHGNSSVYIVKKGEVGTGESINTKNFAGIDHYHSLRAGAAYRTEDDCNLFFEPLKEYSVKIKNQIEKNTLILNKEFYDFNNWDIYDNGKLIDQEKKNLLKKDILNMHVRDIEENWSRKYENYWNSINQSIIDLISSSDKNTICVSATKREELIKFMVSLEWRTKPYHPALLEVFDFVMNKVFDFKSIDIPEDERLYPFLETAYDEMAHSIVLKLYRDFLNGKGHIMNEANKFINNKTLVLLLAPPNKEFLTSDNPVCRFVNQNGILEYIFPINPKVACSVVNGNIQQAYQLRNLTTKEITFYNTKLKDNCYESYILREQNLSLYF
ncbi:DUF4238 domain-containing protein [Bacillus sp. JRC01]|nr:DUF4238 domain-containing protein [Bacillus sp. JRC01]